MSTTMKNLSLKYYLQTSLYQHHHPFYQMILVLIIQPRHPLVLCLLQIQVYPNYQP